jgi:fatty acid desaturase
VRSSEAETVRARPAPARPARQRGSEYARLSRQVRQAGLLERRPGYYVWKITATAVLLAAGWAAFVLVGDSWWQLAVAAFLAVMFTQVGFLGHDAGHRQVFGSQRASYVAGLLLGNLGIGLSFGWWVHKHNAHHAHPNEMGRDPDIGAGVPLASPDARETGAALSRRGWHAGRRRSSSPSCCCEAAVCTYSGSSGFCGDETTPRR